MTLILPALVALGLSPTGCQPDPCQTTARAALAGHYGKLAPWQVAGYTLILDKKAKVQGLAWVTHYGAFEGRQGQVTSSGVRPSLRVTACNRLPQGTYLWIANPCQLRQVLDRGARSNDHVARRKGADLWADLWTRDRAKRNVTFVTEYATTR